MASSRKHTDFNQRVNEAHERKELKEENQRLINMRNKSKPRSKQHRRVNVEFDSRGFVI